jgi:phosphoserine phosphatase
MARTPPIDPVIAALFQDSRRDAETRAGNEKRTTLHAPAADILTLKEVALRYGCSMNDLFLLAIADLFTAVGLVPKLTVKQGLRQKLSRISDKSSTCISGGKRDPNVSNSETDKKTPSEPTRCHLCRKK